MTHDRSGAPDLAAPRYEVRDTSVPHLLQLGLSLCVVIAVALLGVSKLMTLLTARQPTGQPASTLGTTTDLPPRPRLQTTPRLDLAARRKAEDATLTVMHGLIDRQARSESRSIGRWTSSWSEHRRSDDTCTPDEQRFCSRPTR